MESTDILEWIDLINRRPLMVLSDGSLLALRNYIEGFVDGLGRAYKVPNLRLYISLWYQGRINIQSDMLWINQILDINQNKSEAEIKLIILDSLKAYFTENPQWYDMALR